LNLTDITKDSTTSIIDVRSQMEFSEGNAKNSINIPLNEIPNKLKELKLMQPLVLCCAAGVRSEQAVRYLQINGLKEVFNGGSWINVQKMLDC
jgi:rhodanese-related sulfurtransferase